MVKGYKHGNENSSKNGKNLTEGSILKTMLIFAVPMILGNLLQQVYNIADTMVVGRFLGAEALAAVGSAYTLMTFLTSVTIGLCMGRRTLYFPFAIFGAGNERGTKKKYVGIFSVCRCCDSSYECGSIYMDRTGSSPAADSKRGLSSYVYIYQNYFCRNYVYFSV